MAGYTSLAFRLCVRQNGGLGLATTDLVNARSILEGRRRAAELSETCPEDRPIAIQLYGHVIAEMTEAARRMVDQGATLIDINMGCPVRKVVRSGGGSRLMCEAEAATRLVAAIVLAVEPVPVTVKMRLGWDAQSLTAPQLAAAFESVGAAAVIIHGRTRAQGFSGTVNRDGIRAVVEAVRSIPVIGNGDIRTLADADRMFRETGCAAVSIGRGILANPFFPRQLDRWARTGDPGPDPSFAERLDMMRRHFHGLLLRRGEFYACLQFRKTLKWYAHFTRMPKPLYLELINLSQASVFDEVLARVEAAGPTAPLPGHADPRIPVPAGPIDKW
ncbi:MAG: tRNA-dihydrouridine synthase [Isosphaeraceae bacterium]|jgi:nifR3 family TIM-barrel protein|nr:MAG: tRNA-dihydrouridine synthase [Isosphaeraceae bacterium]